MIIEAASPGSHKLPAFILNLQQTPPGDGSEKSKNSVLHADKSLDKYFLLVLYQKWSVPTFFTADIVWALNQ